MKLWFFFFRFKSKRLKRQTHDSDDPSITISDEGNFLQEIDISSIIPDVSRELENSCPAEIAACDPSYPYRSFTGYCNNLRKPNWGKSLTTFSRILPPAYDNGKRRIYIRINGFWNPVSNAHFQAFLLYLTKHNDWSFRQRGQSSYHWFHLKEKSTFISFIFQQTSFLSHSRAQFCMRTEWMKPKAWKEINKFLFTV